MGAELGLPEVVAGVIFAALLVYVCTGGADFGGGVWDLLASGPRRDLQRALIQQAIAPIWEANHVWMILVVVLLFVGFPLAFSTLSTVLHIPLALMLIGIVLRGTAFVFRNHEYQTKRAKRRWGQVFAIGSIITPVFLGIVVAAIASGQIRVAMPEGRVALDFIGAWTGPFPWTMGLLTLALFSFLAAVYLTLETEDRKLAGDFRLRALGSGVALLLLGSATLVVARRAAPELVRSASQSAWAWRFGIAGAGLWLTTGWALWTHRYRVARLVAVALAVVMLSGWGLAQFPYVVIPDLTIANTAAPSRVLQLLLLVLAIAGLVLIPALGYLFVVFKSRHQD